MEQYRKYLENDEVRCLECGTEIYGRHDKKFCCEKCKNAFHNKRSQDLRNMKLRVRTAIEKNYEILSGLLRHNVDTMGLMDLVLAGFKPEYLTSCRRVGRHLESFCYDISYIRTENRVYGIRKRQTKKIIQQ